MLRDEIALSCLHTSSMGAVYGRCGFLSISEIRVFVRILPACGCSSGWMKAGMESVIGKRWCRARSCALPLGVDLPLGQLMAHHHNFHHLRFAGAVVRDDSKYWETYMTANIAGGLGAYWLQEGGNGDVPDDTEGGRLGAFACIKGESSQTESKVRRFYLADFCAAPEHVAADGGRLALETLLRHAISSGGTGLGGDGGSQHAGSEQSNEILLRMPGPVADSMGFRADGQVRVLTLE